jgi:orotate phosphoribosyltransferase
VDDVLTAGTAAREAAALIGEAGGELTGVLIALDRQERLVPEEPGTAVSRLQQELGVPVASLLTLEDVIEYLDLKGGADNHPREVLDAVRTYQAAYCEAR